MGSENRNEFRGESWLGPNVRTGSQIMRTYPLADTAVVLFDLYFWERLCFDSESHGTAVTASSIYFQSLAFKVGKFTRELRWIIGWLVVIPAIIASQIISVTVFGGIRHAWREF